MVAVSPHKPSIMYEVREKGDIGALVKPIARLLCKRELPTDNKVVVFHCTCDKCSHMYSVYLFFRQHLRGDFTDSPGCPDLSRYRVVEMYSRCTETTIKESIMQSFCDPSSPLRIVIATIAFGMGLDSPCVHIHM